MWPDGSAPLVGMGGMRLSTDRDRDDDRAIAVLHAAFDAGINFLDTADAYCLDDRETGHNERLIARALATWTGDRSRIAIATKGGLTRPAGNWIADGRARHLIAACDASRGALGIERIQLYQLHAIDPRTPLATSVRALDTLKEQGRIAAIGLCNVTVGQIEEARQITEIAAVQIELGVFADGNIVNGVAAYCAANGIRLLAYRPLGGVARRQKTRRNPALASVAVRHNCSPYEIALAWLADLSAVIVPLPGPTRIETARSAAHARAIVLTDEDRAELDAAFPAGRILRSGETSRAARAPLRTDGEVVLIMGLPAAGKSTVARTLVRRGYERLNRDEAGGSLQKLLPVLERLAASGTSRIVVDNTYISRNARGHAVEAAFRSGLPIRCLWLTTSVEDAQVNAASRMLSRYGKLLEPGEIKTASKRDPAVFGPGIQFRYQRELEPPDLAEGFSRVDIVPFERIRDPSSAGRALIVWCDGVLWRSRSGLRTPSSADDVEVFENRAEVLRRYHSEGWPVLGLSWQPEIAEKTRTRDDVEAAVKRMKELLGVPIEIEYCPHAAGPPVCWCRKPLPGLGVLFTERHRLDPAQCVYVGTGPQENGFARRLGFQYREASSFFAD